MPPDSLAVFTADVMISPFDDHRIERVRLLVGTGAMWTWVPAEVLRRVGIVPKEVGRFRALDWRVLERQYADARIACRDRECPSLVVFASEGDQSTLGEHALLCMGLEIDAKTRSLRDAGPLTAYTVQAQVAEA